VFPSGQFLVAGTVYAANV